MSRTPAELINLIRYEYPLNPICTMGPCRNGCGRTARGGGECAFCLTAELVRVTGNTQRAGDFWAYTKGAAEAAWELMGDE